MFRLYHSFLVAMAFMAAAGFYWMFGVGGTSFKEAGGPPLPALGVRLDQTTVSGISSGAYMAGQFQMAHAREVIGAALVAGGPYGCAQSTFAGFAPDSSAVLLSATRAVNGCMLNTLSALGVPDVDRLATKARQLAEDQKIDPVADVNNDKIYLFSGRNDRTVVPSIVDAAFQFYRAIGVDQDQILFVRDVRAGHGFVVEEADAKCEFTGPPFVVDCDHDQAGEILKHFYGALNAPSKRPSGQFFDFDQSAFANSRASASLSTRGVVYVPEDCRSTPGCRVHISFHGCSQNHSSVGDAFVKGSGFARWADTNRLIVLFPQVAAGPLNPAGCWDWWGYTGRNYLTKNAPQIKAVRRMLEVLARPPASS